MARYRAKLINMQKSDIIFSSNTFSLDQALVKQIFGIDILFNDEVYLGMPFAMGHNKREAFRIIQKRV